MTAKLHGKDDGSLESGIEIRRPSVWYELATMSPRLLLTGLTTFPFLFLVFLGYQLRSQNLIEVLAVSFVLGAVFSAIARVMVLSLPGHFFAEGRNDECYEMSISLLQAPWLGEGERELLMFQKLRVSPEGDSWEEDFLQLEKIKHDLLDEGTRSELFWHLANRSEALGLWGKQRVYLRQFMELRIAELEDDEPSLLKAALRCLACGEIQSSLLAIDGLEELRESDTARLIEATALDLSGDFEGAAEIHDSLNRSMPEIDREDAEALELYLQGLIGDTNSARFDCLTSHLLGQDLEDLKVVGGLYQILSSIEKCDAGAIPEKWISLIGDDCFRGIESRLVIAALAILKMDDPEPLDYVGDFQLRDPEWYIGYLGDVVGRVSPEAGIAYLSLLQGSELKDRFRPGWVVHFDYCLAIQFLRVRAFDQSRKLFEGLLGLSSTLLDPAWRCEVLNSLAWLHLVCGENLREGLDLVTEALRCCPESVHIQSTKKCIQLYIGSEDQDLKAWLEDRLRDPDDILPEDQEFIRNLIG